MFSKNLLRKSTVAMREKLEQVLNIFQNKVNSKSGGFDIDMQEMFFASPLMSAGV
jgi:hypothetical protein